MGTKLRAAIVGSGNIGTDLVYKCLRSAWIEPAWVVGIDPGSEGLARARELGLRTTAAGLDALLPALEDERIGVVFDATSAATHAAHAERLRDRDLLLVDLTPAALGPFCVPPVNLRGALEALRGVRGARELSMVSCGGQATVPFVAAVSRVQPVAYAEIVATVASRSVGPGTRQNIDEFTRTTARALATVGGAGRGKAIIVINPAEPPLAMRDTVHCLTEEAPDRGAIARSVEAMLKDVQTYVPGCSLKNGPVFEDRRVTLFLEVVGRGDWLPRYAGNLDVMTAAALRTAELYAEATAARELA